MPVPVLAVASRRLLGRASRHLLQGPKQTHAMHFFKFLLLKKLIT
jgi:hypothetical protein